MARPDAAIRERGVIIASGLMAGGALGGVFGAALRLFPWYREDLVKMPWYDNLSVSESVSALMFVALCVYVWFGSLKKVEELRRRMMDAAGTLLRGCGAWHRHAVGRRRDVSLRHGTLHCRLVVQRRSAAAGLQQLRRRRGCASPAAWAPKRSTTRPSMPILKEVDLPAAIAGLSGEAAKLAGLRGKYLHGLAVSLQVMWDLAMEMLGQGPAVPYERCVLASAGRAPEPSQPQAKRERVAELLARAGQPSHDAASLLTAVDAWRNARVTPMASVRTLSSAVIAYFDQLSASHLSPFLPKELAAVPRANIDFMPIKDAWFSGSMNYVGRARNQDGSPQLRGDL